MKDIDVTAVFCEMLSGLAAIALALGLLDLTSQLEMAKVSKWIIANPTFATVATLLIAAYLLGLIVDAFGMAFDSTLVERIQRLRKLLNYDAGQLPPNFYTKATEGQLRYFCEQWAYFSCYRNLLMLMVIGVPVSVALATKYGAWQWIAACLLINVLTIIALIASIRGLQGTMVRISSVTQ